MPAPPCIGELEHARAPLFERQYDVVFSAIEHSFASSTVVTRRVCSLERGIFASPALMAEYPELSTPNDLHAFALLAGSEDAHGDFKGPGGGVEIEVRNPRMRSGNAGIRLEAVKAGLGVIRVTATFCEAALAQGKLVRLLPEWECTPLRIYALPPEPCLVPSKVRVILDELELQGRGGTRSSDSARNARCLSARNASEPQLDAHGALGRRLHP
ncbi:DNA-binding transcriptional LysR family regulator [Variovorax boronicumulans]|uniref:DNA-binding transcriptional LysR family regulator n=1 Tax=Variovorax boronicumulans TaxID=436515 RepID=A0AAW8DUQ9_9BURK|nr:LysR substrate-binding domain-containing protein [Variovorax boronicumulans]MDP9877697.1 DNA-binding transcriptional LysR family regulator [Variovorax boronicumulans]MDP9922981.1 DNA-binding transcriptional LysR family regulator [Variovorax boronicumulans]